MVANPKQAEIGTPRQTSTPTTPTKKISNWVSVERSCTVSWDINPPPATAPMIARARSALPSELVWNNFTKASSAIKPAPTGSAATR